jgi:hypothetical protein
VGRLLLAPDGRALYYLDLTGSVVGKVEAASLKRTATLAVDEQTRALALSPDGKLLVAPWATAEGKFRVGGLRLIDTARMTSRAEVKLDWRPHDVAVGDGTAYVSPEGDYGAIVAVPLGKGEARQVGPAWGHTLLRLAQDGKRLYASRPERGEGRLLAYDLPGKPGGKPAIASSEKASLGGDFSISPDGQYLILHSGAVLRLPLPAGADVKEYARLEPLLAVALDVEDRSAWVVARDGTLRKYSYPDFRLLGRYRPALTAYQVAVDGKAGRLYVAGFDPRSLAERPRAKGHGDIQVYVLRGRLAGR